jgi:PAS domain-containing protein
MDIGTSEPREPLPSATGPAWLEMMHRIYLDADRRRAPITDGSWGFGRLVRAWLCTLRAALDGWCKSVLPELLGISFSIGVIWVSAALLVHDEHADAERHALDETSNLARAFEESVGQTIAETDQVLLSVRSYFGFLGARFDMVEWARAQSRLSSMTAGVHLVDAHGNLFASTGPLPDVPINLADREHFKTQAADKNDVLHISRTVVVGRQTGKVTIQFTRKLLRDGAFAGIAVVSLDASELSRFFGTLELGEGFVALVSLDGSILARGPLVTGAIGKSIADQPYFVEMRSRTSGAVQAGDQIIAFRQLDDYPLLVLVGDDAALVFGNYWSVRRNAFIASGVATVVVVLAGAFWIGLRRRSLAVKRALKVTLESISQGIVMVDNDGRIPVINRRAADLLRLPADVLADGQFGATVPVSGLIQAGALRLPFTLASEVMVSALSGLPGSFDVGLEDGAIVEVRTHRLPAGGMVQTSGRRPILSSSLP